MILQYYASNINLLFGRIPINFHKRKLDVANTNLTELLGISKDQDLAVFDSRVARGKRNSLIGNLRSIPLLYRLGMENYNFKPHWIHRRPVKKEGKRLTDSYIWEDAGEYPLVYDFQLAPPFKYFPNIRNLPSDQLVASTNHKTEEHHDTDVSVRTLLDANINRKVFLLPNNNFRFEGESHGRKIADYGDIVPLDYDKILREYMNEMNLTAPAFKSKNIRLIELEEQFYREKGQTVDRLGDLFNIDKIPEGFPTYQILERFARSYILNKSKLIQTCLYPWVDAESFNRFTQRVLQSEYIVRKRITTSHSE